MRQPGKKGRKVASSMEKWDSISMLAVEASRVNEALIWSVLWYYESYKTKQHTEVSRANGNVLMQ